MFRDYDSIEIGSMAKLHRRISIADVKRFVEMTGDDNPLHVDRDYAEQTSFRDIVVHGMLGASFISTVIGTQLPGNGALWINQSMDFLLPLRLNDEISVVCKVIKKYDRERIIDVETTITNQFGQLVLTGNGKVKLLEPKQEVQSQEAANSRVALVTGGSGGIGEAICLALASKGYAVIVNYLSDQEKAKRVVSKITDAGGRAIALRADVSKTNEVESLMKQALSEFGSISVLVNNASGRIGAKLFLETEWADIESHIDTQLRAAFLLSKACVPHMQRAKFGRIINIVSEVIDSPTPMWMSYCVAKGALATFSRCLAVELGHCGIRVNCVAPGMTDTRLIGDLPERSRLVFARQNPTRRLGKPSDVASAVAYLASEEADFVNGETLRVNGGSSML